jgi:hypothetical protein
MMMNDDDSLEGEIFGTPEFRSAGFLLPQDLTLVNIW